LEIPPGFETDVEELIELAAKAQRDPRFRIRQVALIKGMLSRLPRDRSPFRGAMLTDLGAVSTLLPVGDRSDNLRQAIAAYTEALDVFTPELNPIAYANLQNNLGDAYYELRAGNRVENLARAIHGYEEALRYWILDNALSDGARTQYATAKLNLGVAYVEFPAGDRARNLYQAIACFNDASRVWTPATHPEDYVLLQQNLGNVYRALPAGVRGENLEQAIAAYRRALRLLTRDSSPDDYVTIQTSLGEAYADLHNGNRDQNLRDAIACFKEVLTIRTADASPRDYSATQNLLGVALTQLPSGDRAENLTQAISGFHQALRFFTPEAAPLDYAAVQVNLAHAYRRVFTGDRVENIERALRCYREALRFFTAETAPAKYAAARVGIGGAYAELSTGNRAENLERTIACYQEALRFITPETAPLDYASIQTNLGNCYTSLPVAARGETLERAIACFEEALRFLTAEAGPFDYAHTQASLGQTYAQLPPAHQPGNFEKAISCFTEALRFLTAEAAPFEYAHIQRNLGNVYARLPAGDRAGNLRHAIAAYQEALRFHTLDANPRDLAGTQTDKGNLHFGERDWKQAHGAFAAAIAAKESLYRAATTEIARHAVLAEAANLFSNDAYSLARLARFSEAVEGLEAGKARALAESLDRAQAVLRQADAVDRAAFETARDRIRMLEAKARLLRAPGSNSGDSSEFLNLSDDLRAARLELARAAQRIQAIFPQFMAPGLNFQSIVEAATLDCPLVYLLTTPQGSLGLIVPADVNALDEKHCVWLDDFKSDDLSDMFEQNVTMNLPPGATESFELDGGYQGAQRETGYLYSWLNRTFPILCERLVGPLAARLVELGYRQAALIPCGRLSLLPLSAAALDQVAMTVAPSARAMMSARQATLERNGLSPVLLGIGNPLPSPQPLTFARLEVEGIAALFSRDEHRLLYEQQATLAGVREKIAGATYLHFSCHGKFNDDEPLDSALFLSGGEALKLSDLLDGNLDISRSRLAVLGACQTGISDFRRVPDEAVGFPAGFLQAGVPGVVSTLWSVVDISTALLLTRFYVHHKEEGCEPGTALHRAQAWLRDVSAGELAQRFSELRRLEGSGIPYEQLSQAWRRFSSAQASVKPFAHPLYWAAFTFAGA
jgi:CHAT domain-containing protein/tetratricopeptide (TPR) repeat protein